MEKKKKVADVNIQIIINSLNCENGFAKQISCNLRDMLYTYIREHREMSREVYMYRYYSRAYNISRMINYIDIYDV